MNQPQTRGVFPAGNQGSWTVKMKTLVPMDMIATMGLAVTRV